MSFRDKFKGLIAAEKADAADALFDELDETLNTYSADIRKLKATVREKDGVKPEQLAELEKENADLRQQAADQSKALKKLEADTKGLSEKLAAEQSAVVRMTVEDGLTKGLTELGITKPAMVAAARALLKEKGILNVKTDGDVRKAVATLKKDGKDQEMDLAAYLKDWAASDEGKEFVPAPNNGGSGDGGRRREAGAKSMSRTEFDGMSPKAKHEFAMSGGQVTE